MPSNVWRDAGPVGALRQAEGAAAQLRGERAADLRALAWREDQASEDPGGLLHASYRSGRRSAGAQRSELYVRRLPSIFVPGLPHVITKHLAKIVPGLPHVSLS